MRQKKYETNKAKWSKMLIVRWKSKDALIRSLIINNWARNTIDCMGNIEDNFPLKGCKNFVRQHESTNGIKNVLKLPFGSLILLGGAWTRWIVPCECKIFSKTCSVYSRALPNQKTFDVFGELSFNHLCKVTIGISIHHEKLKEKSNYN